MTRLQTLAIALWLFPAGALAAEATASAPDMAWKWDAGAIAAQACYRVYLPPHL